MVVLPRMTQPASRARAAGGASAGWGGASSLARVPIGEGSPLVAMFSLRVSGTPSSGESGRPARQRGLAADPVHRVQLRLAGGDALEGSARGFDGRELASRVGLRKCAGGQFVQSAHRGADYTAGRDGNKTGLRPAGAARRLVRR